MTTTIKKAVVIHAVRAAVKRVRDRAALAATTKGAAKIANYAQGKAYELDVLVHVLGKLSTGGYTLECTPKSLDLNGAYPVLTFGGSPCKPNHPRHDRIRAETSSQVCEVWVSLQFTTLSYFLRKQKQTSPGHSDRHEIDVGVYTELTSRDYPNISQVLFAASCKTGGWSKAYVREALGMRRELGWMTAGVSSLSPWFALNVPSAPAIPMVLYSSNSSCGSYRSLMRIGLYVKHYP